MARSFEEEIAELTAAMEAAESASGSAMNDAAAKGTPFQYQPPVANLDAGTEALFAGWDPGQPFPASSGSIMLDVITDAASRRLTLTLMTSAGLLHARPLAAVDELGWFPAVLPEGAVLILNTGQLQGVVIPPDGMQCTE